MKTVKYFSKIISPFIQEGTRIADKAKSIEMQVNIQFLKTLLASVNVTSFSQNVMWMTELCAGCIWCMWTTVCRAGGGHGRESKVSLSVLLRNLVCILDGVCLHIPLPSLFHERINCFEQHKSHCGPVVGLKREPKEGCFQVSIPVATSLKCDWVMVQSASSTPKLMNGEGALQPAKQIKHRRKPKDTLNWVQFYPLTKLNHS